MSKRARRKRAEETRRVDSDSSEMSRETLPPRDTPLPSNLDSRSPAIMAKRFGRYEILRELGHGAMGSVYLALDTQLRRQVALKIPKFNVQDGPEFKERFHREARAAATLSHRNICAVYDIGEIDSVPYMTMAYIDGATFGEYAARELKSSKAIAAMVRKLALALQEAHDKGIIHRDLKPANILVDAKCEPILMDFGLARQMNATESVRITHSGVLLGSPAYMSPEQVEGRLDELGPTADIYSLGVVLYELLTGELPFRGSVAVVIGQIVTCDPLSPSERNPSVDRRLEAICLKMMAKKAEDRYLSMTAVANALDAYLKDSESNGDDGFDESTMTELDAGSLVTTGTNVARGLAILGLVLIDFRWAVASGTPSLGWLNWMFERIDGRATSLFVVLMGMGLSLASKRAWRTGDVAEVRKVRKAALIRALILFVVGYAFIKLWPGDLLHYGGAYLAIGAMLLARSGRVLWTFAILLILLFPGLYIALEAAGYGYNREALLDVSSSFGGIVRDFFFHGYHPIVPWASFFLAGMWLGRLNFQKREIQYRVFWIALAAALATELLSALNVMILSSLMAGTEKFDYTKVVSLFGTTPWPPLPIFMVAAGSTAVAIVAACMIASDRRTGRLVRQLLADCGRISVTLYVAHVVLGMGLLRAMDRLGGQSLAFAATAGLALDILLIVFALFWCRWFRRGPMEWLIWKAGG